MKNFLALIVTILALCSIVPPAGAALVESTFDSGSEGWLAYQSADLSWYSSGGNPGGYLHFDDAGRDGYWAQAPAAFLGDLTENIGGYLSFDYRLIWAPPGTINPYIGTVRIYSSNGDFASLDFITRHPPPYSWTTYQQPLSAGIWGKSESEWRDLLSDVTALWIFMEPGGFPDASALDNVAMDSVPLPAAFYLFGSALIGLIGFSRNKRSCQHRGASI